MWLSDTKRCRFPMKKHKCDIACGQEQRGTMSRCNPWGRKGVRFRYRGRRSEIGGRRTRNDGRRTPGAGETGREEGGCSLGMINTTRTPSSHESSEDGSRSTRNWTFSICKSDEKLVYKRVGRGTHKMISCLLMLRSYCATRLNLSDSLGGVSPYFCKINYKNAITKRSCILGLLRQWTKLCLKFMFLRASERGYAILAFYYALSSLWRLFQYIW